MRIFMGEKTLFFRISSSFQTNISYHVSICISPAPFKMSCLNTPWNNSLRDNNVCNMHRLIVLGFQTSELTNAMDICVRSIEREQKTQKASIFLVLNFLGQEILNEFNKILELKLCQDTLSFNKRKILFVLQLDYSFLLDASSLTRAEEDLNIIINATW